MKKYISYLLLLLVIWCLCGCKDQESVITIDDISTESVNNLNEDTSSNDIDQIESVNGFCGLTDDMKKLYEKQKKEIKYGENDFNNIDFTFNGQITNIHDLLNTCINDNVLQLDTGMAVNTKEELLTYKIAANSEENIRFIKDDNIAVYLVFKNNTEEELELSKCDLFYVSIYDVINISIPGNITFGNNIEDMINAYGTCYDTASFSGIYYWQTDESEYKMTVKTDTESNNIIQFDWEMVN